jgi:hypothetical protein
MSCEEKGTWQKDDRLVPSVDIRLDLDPDLMPSGKVGDHVQPDAPRAQLGGDVELLRVGQQLVGLYPLHRRH